MSLDFILTTKPWDPEDITYCTSKDCMADCWRRLDRVDWELPKHKYWGCSMSEFGPACASYKPGGENNES